jgi:hypothetical protein
MQTHNKNIDQLFNEKANAFHADGAMAAQDWAAIKNSLPKVPGTAPTHALPKTKPYWFSLNTLIISIAVITIVAFVLTKMIPSNNNTTNTKTNHTPVLATNNNVINDTPVVLTEIPKDPSKAPKRWVVKMKIGFNPVKPLIIKEEKRFIDVPTTTPTNTDSKEKAAAVLHKFISQIGSTSQYYTIDVAKDNTITCKQGTKLTITANTFETNNKQLVQGIVQVEVKEAYSYTDILANNLHTISNGNLLESGGMVYLKVTQNNELVTINIHHPIQVEMPTSNKKEGMQLFNLVNNDWMPNGQEQETIVQRDTVLKELDIPLNGMDYTPKKNSNTILVNKDFSKMYHFLVRNFGWMNCDHFIHYTNPKTNIEIAINNPNSYYVLQTGYLVFPKLKSSIFLMPNTSGFMQNNLPLGEEAYFISFKTDEHKVWSIIQKVIIDRNPIKAADYEELTPAQVKAKLNALGGVQ